jgi:hypothetical protein
MGMNFPRKNGDTCGHSFENPIVFRGLQQF